MSETTKKPNVIQELIIAVVGTSILGSGISAICILLDKLLIA